MKLGRAFYSRDTLAVARELVGMHLCVALDGRVLSARVVETEAYIGEDDRACHASRRTSKRARIMYGRPGVAYVYFVYGAHHMLNAVTEPEGSPAAVLIRACEPAEGLDASLSGPGKLCRALGLDLADNGADLCGERIWFEDRRTPARKIARGPRVGVDYAGPWAKKPWRFADADSAHVSRPRLR